MIKNSRIYNNLKKIVFLRNLVVRLKHEIFSLRIHRNGLKAINLLSKTFTEIGLNLSLNYGSLLGIYRNGALIKHDPDVDLILFKMNSQDLDINFNHIKKVLSESKSIKKSLLIFPERGLITCKVFKCLIDIKVGNYDKNLNKYYFRKNTYSIWIDAFKQINLNDGSKIWIPTNSENLLERYYGKGWRIPDKSPYEFRKK